MLVDHSDTTTSSTPSAIPPEPNPDQLSNVSLLAKKYLLFDNGASTSSNSKTTSCVVKNYPRVVKVETREQYSCKMVSRTQEGLQLIAGYHRLDTNCEAISQVHEVILSPKSFYLIMPPTYGNVHAYLLAKKKLREAEAANIFKQMVTAVQVCHSKGIVLRDLKMGKFVFHDRERTIVRLDTLEDAVLLNDLSDDGLSDKHGCPNYVSPEKAEILRSNKKYPGKSSDMWGLGVILYTMLVGRYPFNDEDHSKLFVKIRRGHYNIPDGLSGPAKCLIRCLLQKDPSARPSCGEILNHSWINSGGEGGAGRANGACSSRANPTALPAPHRRLINNRSAVMVSSSRINSAPNDNSSSSSVNETPGTAASTAFMATIVNHQFQAGPTNGYELTSSDYPFNTNYDLFPSKLGGSLRSRVDDQVVPNLDF